MFGLFSKKNKAKELVAPATGKLITLDKVPDEAFATKALGDGVAVDITGDTVVSPCDGTLSLVFGTGHAFMLQSEDGLEILVHIGIDTVNLKGEGFEVLAEQGIKVKKGTPIIKIDNEFIKSKGYSLACPVVITNMDSVESVNVVEASNVAAGKEVVVRYSTK